MLRIIPTLEVLRPVVDNNINSAPAKIRVHAFDKANELASISKGTIIIEGQTYDRIKSRLKPEHEKIFKYLYFIDYTGLGVPNYNISSTINFIAKREAKPDWVIILTENTTRHKPADGSKKIAAIAPADFISRMVKFKAQYDTFIDLLEINPQAREVKTQLIEGMILELFFDHKL